MRAYIAVTLNARPPPTQSPMPSLPGFRSVVDVLDQLSDDELKTLIDALDRNPNAVREAVGLHLGLRAHPTTLNILHDYGMWTKHVDPERKEFTRESFYQTDDDTKLEVMRAYGLATDDYITVFDAAELEPDCGGRPDCKTHRGGSHNMTTNKECRR